MIGVWLFGSCALCDYDPGFSDIDIQAVARGPLSRQERLALSALLSHRALPCPARGLEFVLYSRDGVAPSDGPRFQLNLNTGSRMRERIALEPDEEPLFWFVIDLAIGRDHGIPLIGPPASAVLPEIPRAVALDALADSLSWFERNEGHSAQTVLSACRAWAYLADGAWLSKTAAAGWTRERFRETALIDGAIHRRTGPLDPSAVKSLLERVGDELSRARADSSRRGHSLPRTLGR